MKKNKQLPKNQTIKELLDEYTGFYWRLKDSYENMTGKPLEDDDVGFWEQPVVKEVTGYMQLWDNIRYIRETEGHL